MLANQGTEVRDCYMASVGKGFPVRVCPAGGFHGHHTVTGDAHPDLTIQQSGPPKAQGSQNQHKLRLWRDSST
jgi:hypothetical protein